MSQKTRIIKVKHSGASIYLGNDKFGNPMWTRDPNKIMDYFCDGHRYYFNQFRALRNGRGDRVEDPETGEVTWINKPLGGHDVKPPPSVKDIRVLSPWMACVPSRVLEYARLDENKAWFAALKAMRTKKNKGMKPGKAPGFRSRKQNQIFKMDRHQIVKLNKERYKVTITVMVPTANVKPGEKSRKTHVDIFVQTSTDIRDHSSFQVNWTKKSLVFLNAPLPIERTSTGVAVGVDMGVANTVTLSTGEFIGIPRPSLTTKAEHAKLQRKESRVNRIYGENVQSSRRRKRTARMNKITRKDANRRENWVHNTTRQLVEKYDRIAIEDLKIANMTSKGKGKRKSSLNRSILESNWGQFRQYLTYKTELAGVKLDAVNPSYTSQACFKCGHQSRENRESQANFTCVECGHTDNADVNAAKNILARASK